MQKYVLAPDSLSGENSELTDYPPLVQKLLINRKITTKKEAERFLNPDYDAHTYDPFLILNMERAVERVLSAIDNNERVVVYGDYDFDGIPGSVILHDLFKKIGYENFSNYIPHRHHEGYGLNTEAISKFAKENTKLLITVDCGITDVEPVQYAQSLGIDVIITDHHLPQDPLPPAYTILNSKQEDDSYPDPMLCGAGVAFKLAQAILQKRDFGVTAGWEKWLLDLAGLSTIGDMVPLQNENRVLAHFGLKVLKKTRRPGLLHLFRKAGISQNHITETDVGFFIGPRINAASRMDTPMRAFTLLATEKEEEAGTISKHLEDINTERKWKVAHIVKDIKKKLSGTEPKDVIVVGNPKWAVGLLGIAANKIMEEYERPVFLWGREGSMHVKGSCRSDGTVNVVELMGSLPEDIFLDAGGHELSGGFSISHEKIHLLEPALIDAYKEMEKKNVSAEVIVDDILTLEDVNWNTYSQIEKFAPFGIGNRAPIFLFKSIRIEKIIWFGKNKEHLRLSFSGSNGKRISAISFFADSNNFSFGEFREGENINLVASFEKSVFGGRTELRLRVIDILSTGVFL